jgi:hypothetical protein
MSLVPEEEDEGGWDSCIMEGYLQIRGGKMGDGKHKQKYLTNSLYSRATHRAMYLIKGRFDQILPDARYDDGDVQEEEPKREVREGQYAISQGA